MDDDDDFGPDFYRGAAVQVSSVMRRGRSCFFHYCPACEQMHPLPFSWKFDGDLERPTFTPSFRQNPGEPKIECHYIVTRGEIHFCADSHHRRSDVVPMVPLVSVGYADL